MLSGFMAGVSFGMAAAGFVMGALLIWAGLALIAVIAFIGVVMVRDYVVERRRRGRR